MMTAAMIRFPSNHLRQPQPSLWCWESPHQLKRKASDGGGENLHFPSSQTSVGQIFFSLTEAHETRMRLHIPEIGFVFENSPTSAAANHYSHVAAASKLALLGMFFLRASFSIVKNV